MKNAPITVPVFRSLKGKKKLTALSLYENYFAGIVDGMVDLILVGDSLSSVVYGFDSTLPVGMERMLYHVEGVARAVKKSLLVADMPFMSYQASFSDALKNAGEFLKVGAKAVKLEGGEEVAELVFRMTASGIPVMGHIGLTPQFVNTFGGYRLQGRDFESAEKLLKDAVALEEAGVFSIVVEGVPNDVAKVITESVDVPTIGIGAGSSTDGQILVLHDLLGLLDGVPRFVRKYARLREEVADAVRDYVGDVIDGSFPSAGESYGEKLTPEERKRLYEVARKLKGVG